MADAARGRKDTPETTKKRSLAKIGDKNINYGKERDPLTKQKISAKLKGKPSYVRTEETRRKASEAAKLRWAKRKQNSENRQEGDL